MAVRRSARKWPGKAIRETLVMVIAKCQKTSTVRLEFMEYGWCSDIFQVSQSRYKELGHSHSS